MRQGQGQPRGTRYPVSAALRKADGTEDGKIVVAGQFGVARFNANGTLDGNFGNAGIMDNPDSSGDAVAILGNGDIVVAGTDYSDFAVAIYKETGERCSAATTDFNGDIDEALAVAIQSDGKILLLGHAGIGSAGDFALARYKGGNCPLRLWLGLFLAYHIFVHPQELVGPPVPPEGPIRDKVYDQLQIGPSEQLAIPALDGSAFTGEKRPGYQAFELTNAAGESRQNAPFVAVTNALGDLSLELLDVHELLVPTDIAAGRVGGETMSGSQSAPLLKCYRVKIESGARAQRARKPFIITDGLKRTWTFAVGEPESLCKPIDRRGRELIGPALSLVAYQVNDVRTDTSPKPVALPTASEFGVRVLQVEQPELLFVPSLAE